MPNWEAEPIAVSFHVAGDFDRHQMKEMETNCQIKLPLMVFKELGRRKHVLV